MSVAVSQAVRPPSPYNKHRHQSSRHHYSQHPQQNLHNRSSVSTSAQPTSSSSSSHTHPPPYDQYYGHEDTARICARYVSFTFQCPETLPPPPPQPSSADPSSRHPHVPSTLAHFVAYALHRTRLHSSVTFLALALLHRLKSRFPAARGSSGHRLFLAAFMLSSKVACDDTYSNKSWAVVGQGMFALREVNQMEREMCGYLAWNLNVCGEELKAFEEEVRRVFRNPPPYTDTTIRCSLSSGVGGPKVAAANAAAAAAAASSLHLTDASPTTIRDRDPSRIDTATEKERVHQLPTPTDSGPTVIPHSIKVHPPSIQIQTSLSAGQGGKPSGQNSYPSPPTSPPLSSTNATSAESTIVPTHESELEGGVSSEETSTSDGDDVDEDEDEEDEDEDVEDEMTGDLDVDVDARHTRNRNSPSPATSDEPDLQTPPYTSYVPTGNPSVNASISRNYSMSTNMNMKGSSASASSAAKLAKSSSLPGMMMGSSASSAASAYAQQQQAAQQAHARASLPPSLGDHHGAYANHPHQSHHSAHQQHQHQSTQHQHSAHQTQQQSQHQHVPQTHQHTREPLVSSVSATHIGGMGMGMGIDSGNVNLNIMDVDPSINSGSGSGHPHPRDLGDERRSGTGYYADVLRPSSSAGSGNAGSHPAGLGGKKIEKEMYPFSSSASGAAAALAGTTVSVSVGMKRERERESSGSLSNKDREREREFASSREKKVAPISSTMPTTTMNTMNPNAPRESWSGTNGVITSSSSSGSSTAVNGTGREREKRSLKTFTIPCAW